MDFQRNFRQKIFRFFFLVRIFLKKNHQQILKKILKKTGRKISHTERYTRKFRNQPISLMHHNAIRVAGAVIRNPPGNRDQFPFCRCDILDAHRDRNAVSPAAVGGNPEGLVSEREDGAAMGNTARVHFTRTVHGDAGVSFSRFHDLHA
jgi:hypothetical protein